jgi:hypothetical protein
MKIFDDPIPIDNPANINNIFESDYYYEIAYRDVNGNLTTVTGKPNIQGNNVSIYDIYGIHRIARIAINNIVFVRKINVKIYSNYVFGFNDDTSVMGHLRYIDSMGRASIEVYSNGLLINSINKHLSEITGVYPTNNPYNNYLYAADAYAQATGNEHIPYDLFQHLPEIKDFMENNYGGGFVKHKKAKSKTNKGIRKHKSVKRRYTKVNAI